MEIDLQASFEVNVARARATIVDNHDPVRTKKRFDVFAASALEGENIADLLLLSANLLSNAVSKVPPQLRGFTLAAIVQMVTEHVAEHDHLVEQEPAGNA